MFKQFDLTLPPDHPSSAGGPISKQQTSQTFREDLWGEMRGCWLAQKEVIAEAYETVHSCSNGKLQPSYSLFLVIQEQWDGKASPYHWNGEVLFFIIKIAPQTGFLLQRAQEFCGDCKLKSSVPERKSSAWEAPSPVFLSPSAWWFHFPWLPWLVVGCWQPLSWAPRGAGRAFPQRMPVRAWQRVPHKRSLCARQNLFRAWRAIHTGR